MQQILFVGNPVHLTGTPPTAGEPARDFTVHRFSREAGLEAVTLADLPAKPRLLSIVPSLDTPVCSTQTKQFNERLASYGDAVVAYTISVDLPFAQNRFCGAESVENMVTLSDYYSRSFGTSWGVLIDELHLLARAVFVIDAGGTITYAEVVPDAGQYPDYDAALSALDELVAAG
jgi:thioredoxin-dependent peroxiredoxin